MKNPFRKKKARKLRSARGGRVQRIALQEAARRAREQAKQGEFPSPEEDNRNVGTNLSIDRVAAVGGLSLLALYLYLILRQLFGF